MDITERNRIQDALQQAQVELAHVSRVTTLGELTASIAHEVNQPLAAIVTNGEICVRLLTHEVPDLDQVRGAIDGVISNGRRASDIIRRIRALSKKTDTQQMRLNLNEVIEEVVLLVQREVLSHRVSLRLELASGLPQVLGDRVQVQQVVINLLINGIQAMASVTDRARELLIRSRQYDSGQVLIAVQDSGIGVDPQTVNQAVQRLLHHQARRHGHGTFDLPFDC